MDPADRAEILFAQLDVLLAAGSLDAARDLAGRLRDHVHSPPEPGGDLPQLPTTRRTAVLEPLTVLLRQQLALVRDLGELIQLIEKGGSGAFDLVEPGALGTLLERSVEDIFYTLDGLAEPMDELSAQRLRTEAGRAVAVLRKAVRSGRVRPVREALDRMERMARELAPEQAAESQLRERLDKFLRLLDPTGRRVQAEDLADRQAAVARRIAAPPEGQELDALRTSLAEARAGMQKSHTSLLRRDLAGAREAARGAARAVAEATRMVDRALGANPGAAPAGTGFLTAFVAGTQPEWELPAAVGLRFHEELSKLPRDARRELTALARRLMDQGEADARVEYHLDNPDSSDGAQTIDVHVTALWRKDGARYVVRLGFQQQTDGTLVPARGIRARELPTYGGRAQVLLATVLEDCTLTILRLDDRGLGGHVGYLDGPDPALRAEVRRRIDEDLVLARREASPVRGEVLGWLDDIDNEADTPIPEEILRALGIPWYDPSDLVDKLRPVHEALALELLDEAPAEEGQDPRPGPVFPGIAWLGPDSHALLHPDLGKDGRSPRLLVPSALVRYLAWLGKESDKKPGNPSFTHLMAALQLHLGFKLAMYDDLDAARTGPWIHKAARALERAYLESRGLPATCLLDAVAELAMRCGADQDAQDSPSPWERWSRHAENLFDARAGEELLRGGRLPAAVVFGPLRGTLSKALHERGLLAAARSADEFAALRDAAILFGNLVIEPETGEGVLIVGDSKLGKSSITARLVAGTGRGITPWRFGASDRILLLVPAAGEGPDGTDRAVATASPAHRRFGQWTAELWYRDARKREVKPRDHAVSKTPVPLRSIAFVHRDGGELRSPGLPPATIADLVSDFQTRFGFGASRRFWRSLFTSCSLVDVVLRRRGADTFHEAADTIRAHMKVAQDQRGLGTPRMIVVEDGGVWFGIAPDRRRIRITRVGRDGLDVDYFIRSDGSATALAAHLGKEVQLLRPRGWTLDKLGTLIPLDPLLVEELYEQPHHRVPGGRVLPLTPEYFRSTMSGPCFFVPDLPQAVLHQVARLMQREPGDRWQGYLEKTP